ncbi:hypothetical protein QJS04_geneDACA015002 [Acorus gramineus]|uniref:Galectin n=1 Tax=Acorus gramineus TaxID=55184 RepID=A0AAV9BX97_ACOGR|nr:hypothetical protein QJS04_geneDACA015002 [Acorus gramineus]
MHLKILVHALGFGKKGKPTEDVHLQIGFAPVAPKEITVVYAGGNLSMLVCRGSSVVRIEDLYAKEDRWQQPHIGVGEFVSEIWCRKSSSIADDPWWSRHREPSHHQSRRSNS